MSIKLLQEAIEKLTGARIIPIDTGSNVSPEDPIGPIICEFSRFRSDPRDPTKPSIQLQFLQLHGGKISIGTTEKGGRCFWDGAGLWIENRGEKLHRISAREAVETFCSTEKEGKMPRPDEFVLYLERELIALAATVISPGRMKDFDPA